MSNIIFENTKIEEHQLESRINSIACLIRKFSEKNGRIGIAVNRTPDLIASILGASRSGVPFMAIDMGTPVDRMDFMLRDAAINLILTSRDIQVNLSDVHTISIDEAGQIRENEYAGCDNYNSTIYIIYTSGSTGQPKGIEITRDALLNFIDGISEIIDFSAGKRIACLTTVSFDIFFLESIMALYKGLTVVLANEDEQRNPRLMAKLIQDNAVDMIQMTPSRMQLLLNHDMELSCLRNVKEIMIGGEPFPLSLLRTLQEKTTAKIYNLYGPTETTIWSTVSDLTNKGRIDIGHPIKNTEVYIVDENLMILPSGQVGEICIAGKGLAKGYIGRDDLTSEKFVCLPQKPNTRIYRTGDIGRYLTDGTLEYLGRADNQVKIRGYRIELEEIETTLNQFDSIKQSVVTTLEMSENSKVLVVFYTSGDNIDTKDIVDYLSAKLPTYMIPSVFKRVESFIQTANGKIDRNRVLECIELGSEINTHKEVTTNGISDIQNKVFAAIYSTISEKITGEVSLDTDFTSIGMDSITFIKTVVAIEGEFGFEFDDEMLAITNLPTVKSMIEYVETKVAMN